MQKKQNRFKVGKLFVLGAGASYANSVQTSKRLQSKFAPLDKDFCRVLENLENAKQGWVNKTKKSLISRWKDHRPFSSFGLEEAIICQLGHLEFIKSIHKRRRNEYTAAQFLNEITHLITYVLSRAQNNQSNLYQDLATLVVPDKISSAKDVRNRVITFNYDTLFDRHLDVKVKPHQLYFDRICLTKDASNNRRPEIFPDPILLKLHGSMNWQTDRRAFAKLLFKNSSDKSEWIDKIWLIGHDEYTKPEDNSAPTIIPPLPNKPLTGISLFEYLWTKAAEYLSTTEELIICGYSLPGTDSLGGSLFGSFENKSLKTITIIDPSPEILMKWKKLLSRSEVKTKSWNYYSDLREYLDANKDNDL